MLPPFCDRGGFDQREGPCGGVCCRGDSKHRTEAKAAICICVSSNPSQPSMLKVHARHMKWKNGENMAEEMIGCKGQV